MEDLLNRLFTDHGFNEPVSRGNALFYEKQDGKKPEYYLVNFVSPNALKGYMEGESAANVFDLFNQQTKEKQDVEKNTSLIICVQVDNIKQHIVGIKNDILLIEEDDYWFKKYIIVYSKESLPPNIDTTNFKDYFEALLTNNQLFKQYKEGMYNNEEYFLTIQLFLKLPFLNVPINSTNNYHSIEQLLEQLLTPNEMQLFYKLRELEDLYSDDYWEQLKHGCVSTTGANEIVNAFLKQFESNA